MGLRVVAFFLVHESRWYECLLISETTFFLVLISWRDYCHTDKDKPPIHSRTKA